MVNTQAVGVRELAERPKRFLTNRQEIELAITRVKRGPADRAFRSSWYRAG